MIYEPQEDSLLLQKAVQQYAKGKVLDLGTGSGIQAITAAQKKNVTHILAVDVQKIAIAYCKEKYSFRKNKKKPIFLKKITWLQSNLFSHIPKNKKFDTIIFNPPYLPKDPGIQDRRIYGGKKGYELIEKAFQHINDYLTFDGYILLLFSSLTQQQKIEEILFHHAMDFEKIREQHISFEDLFVYKIEKNAIRKILEKKKYTHIQYFTKGKRGFLYTAKKKQKKYVVKIKNPQSKAQNSITNEARWLKLLNTKKIGPHYQEQGNNHVLYSFVPGTFIGEWINQQNNKEKIKKVLISCLQQCRTLDLLKIDKEEMHHPFKHIIISKNKPVFLDFERCSKVKKPKNVTQFCQCISYGLSDTLKTKKFFVDQKKMKELAQNYKEHYDKQAFDHIQHYLKTL
ncbi:methyltransferase [Candidatus Woesearchaeota archaeon]|nr:methyltransferase [Candidatus Woesearchaeota archaeon]